MVDVVKADAQNKKKPGRRPKLIIEDQVLMVIQYWREYRTYYHIGLDWGLSESAVCRTVYKIENILIKSKKFSFPGKKELWKMSSEENLVYLGKKNHVLCHPRKIWLSWMSWKAQLKDLRKVKKDFLVVNRENIR